MQCHQSLHSKEGRCFGANRSTRVTWPCGERSRARGQTVAAENWNVDLFRGSLKGRHPLFSGQIYFGKQEEQKGEKKKN